MVNKTVCNVNAYSEAINTFKEKIPLEMAEKAGAIFDAGRNIIKLLYFNTPVEISFPTGEIQSHGGLELTRNDKVLILQYLTAACGLLPKNIWISFLQLPGGPHHHTPFVIDGIKPIAKMYGDRIDAFKSRAAEFGAVETKLGDYGVVISVFPYIPLAVCLWAGDEEFAANANILFDITAPLHLTTAALWVLGIEASRKLRGVQGQQYSRE